MSRHTWRVFFFLELCIVRMLLSGVRLQLGNAKNGVDIETETQLNGWGTFFVNLPQMSWRPVDPKLSAFNLQMFSNDWRFILIGWIRNTFFSDWLLVCCLRIFATHGFSWISLYLESIYSFIGPGRRSLEVLSVASFFRPIWIQRPRHPRPGLQGWGSETPNLQGFFCEKHRRPGVVFVVRNLWSSGVHVESDSPRMIPKTLQFLVVRRTRQSPQSPPVDWEVYGRPFCDMMLWRLFDSWLSLLDIWTFFHFSFIIDIWCHHAMKLWHAFLTKWQDDVIAMSKLARDPAMYLALWLWSCSVSPWAFTFRVKVVR